jgi:pimeloyl-ACP methyl ester carboxylesterase
VRFEVLAADTIAREGLRLNWLDSGGGGMPVVFQHGLCGDARQTAEVFPDDPRFRLITMECRGQGNSEASAETELSIAAFAGDVAALIDELGGVPVVIGGISMGAAIALRLAVTRPDLVRALIIARPAWLTGTAPQNMQPNAEVGRLLGALPPAAARAEFAAGETARRLASVAPDNLASLMSFFDREPVAVTARLLTAIAADGPGVTEAALRRLTVPTLVIGTERDAVHPWSFAHTIADLIPPAKLVTITPKATDKTAYVREFQQALQAFLEDI